MAYLALETLKKHLNFEEGFTDDDTYLTNLIDVVELAIADYCKGGLDSYTAETMPKVVQHAALLLAAHLYQNRGMVSFAQGFEIPYSFKFLLNPYMNFSTAETTE